MSVYFQTALDNVLKIEGGYSDDPVDRGGKTRYGITEALARLYGYEGDMRELPLDLAKRIYKEEFWNTLSGDKVASFSQRVAEELFDTAINMGTRTAVVMLQSSLNALNRDQLDYADIPNNGRMDTITELALQAYFLSRRQPGEDVLLKCLNALQGARYIAIAEQDRTQERFLYGWINKRVGL